MRLLFRREFRQAILEGAKTQTVRLWVRQWVRAGQVCDIPHVGRAEVARVTPIDLEDLTEADARADGFGSLPDLLAKIAEIYGAEAPTDRAFYRVEFKFLGEGWPADSPALFE